MFIFWRKTSEDSSATASKAAIDIPLDITHDRKYFQPSWKMFTFSIEAVTFLLKHEDVFSSQWRHALSLYAFIDT